MNTSAKYITIARQIIANIEQGHIETNSKLPSLRTFCQLHHISMTTALACYRYLEQHGYVIAEYKKGYFVQAPSPTKNAIHFPVFQSTITTNITRQDLHSDGAGAQSLAIAQLDTKLIDDHLLKRSLKATTKQNDFTLSYDEAQGSGRLRQALSKHFNSQGFLCPHQELVITHGCLDAVLIAIECVSKPNDVIAITSPCYSGLLDLLAILDRSILEIPSTSNGIELVQLEQAMETKNISACLLTANHQNPTGHNLSNQQKQDIVTLAAKYSIPIIEDDVFRELSHQRTIPLPLKYFDQEGWVIWCSSVSKTLAPGLRIGWCLPGRFKNNFIQQRMVRSLGHNQPIQLALADYIGNRHYERHIKKVNRALAVHCANYIDFLDHHLPEGAEIFTPNGGLVLWIKMINVNTDKLSTMLSKQAVYIKAGNLFSTTKLYQDCLRINIGQVPTKQVYAQLALLCKLAQDETTLLSCEH
jgi:DNA-binding transcriptional MocR family regulator